MVTPKRTAKAAIVNDAATFDFDSFLAGFKRPVFKRTLFQRADLIPELARREAELDDIEKRIERLEKVQGEDAPDRGIADVDPLFELRQRYDTRVVEYNDLAEEYQQSGVEFEFRPGDAREDIEKVDQLLEDDGIKPPVKSDDDTDGAEFEVAVTKYFDDRVMRSMAVMCSSHPLTVPEWYRLRGTVGEQAFSTLGSAYAEAMRSIRPDADFLPRHSPTPTSDES